jgi:hypothetical protein
MSYKEIGEHFKDKDGVIVVPVESVDGLCSKKVGRAILRCKYYKEDCGDKVSTFDRSICGECEAELREDKKNVIFIDIF